MLLDGKPPVSNWHIAAYREGRLDEIEPNLLPLVKERVEAQDLANKGRAKPKAEPVPVVFKNTPEDNKN